MTEVTSIHAPKIMKLYRREDYLQKIRGFYHDTGIIKVITGVRRCGKSCLMETISLELKENGVRDENIIYLNLDKRGFRKIKTADQLDALIEERSAAEGTKYLFIDEIQNVNDFEEVINGYREEEVRKKIAEMQSRPSYGTGTYV